MQLIKLNCSLAITLSLILSSVSAQEINIGKKIPDIEFAVSNYKSKKLKISDLKGKLVILDFWAPGCIPCLQTFPKLQALQKRFGDRIQIVLVNAQSKDSTERFFAKSKKVVRPDIPFISGDKILHRFFPHRGVPYHIWLDTSGIVRYKADLQITNDENIRRFLSGSGVVDYYSRKKKTVTSMFDSSLLKNLEYFSYISHCTKGVHVAPTQRKGYIETIYNCASVVDLYKRAFGLRETWKDTLVNRPGRIFLEMSDSLKFMRPKDGHHLTEWLENYSYNYHLFLPESQGLDFRPIMQEDLRRYFHLDAKIEYRSVKCLVLLRNSDEDKLRSKGGTKAKTFTWSDERTPMFDSIRGYVNEPYSQFSEDFRIYIEAAFDKPFVDATGFDENIDISFTGDTIDKMQLAAIRKELNRYDLKLVEMDWPIKVLAIRESVKMGDTFK